jgi:glycosyltransferase involved in cell wall biosynthesis
MKVLLCHNFYQQWGGEDQVFMDEASMLRDGGHEVLTYTRHNDDIKQSSRLAVARDTFWNRRTFDEVRHLLREERPELIHCTNTFPLISPAIYDAAAAEGVPVVQSLHNYRLLCPNAFFVYDGKTCEACLSKTFAWPAIARKCYRGSTSGSAVLAGMTAWHRIVGTWRNKVHTYIALSEFSRRKFIAGGLPADRIVVKANSMDRDPEVGNGAGGYAVFMARLSSEKGIGILLDAWSRLSKPIPLKILGTGPLEHLAREAATRHSHIEWLGRQTPAEVLEIVGQAACKIIPSINYEHCPKVLIEANAKGTPAIASDIGALGEMIEQGRNGFLVAPGDADALAAKVEEVFADRHLLQSLRHSSRLVYDERWTSERNYARLVEIYAAVVGRTTVELEPSSENSVPLDTHSANATSPSSTVLPFATISAN